MPSPAATIRRLLGALEELGLAEEVALACGDGVAFLALKHRAEPLVARISALIADNRGADDGLDDTLRARGQALIREQHARGTRLHTLLDHVRNEITRIDQARLHARNLRPAYGLRHASPGLRPAFAGQG